MQNTMRKFLSAVLVFVLFLGMVPMAAMHAAAATELTEVAAWNLTLADEIAVNFYVCISNAAAEDAVMLVTDGYGTTRQPIANAEKNEKGQYLFTARLRASQLTESIQLQLVSGEQTGPVHTYTAYEYAKTVLSGDYSQSVKDLILAMLNYGAAAQLYFNYNVENLANAGYEMDAVQSLPAPSDSSIVNGSVSGSAFYAASLVFNSRVAVRFYFNVTGSIEDYTFTTVNGSAYPPVAKDGYYYVEVPGINPQDYDKQISLQVTDGADTMTVSYSPMTYILRKYASTENAKLQNLVAAMYSYNKAAESYLNASADVTTDGNGIVTEQVILKGAQSSAVVAAGTQLEENTTTLTLSINPLGSTGSDVVLGENEQMVSMDVHVTGISQSNTVPVLVTLDELAPEFLNQGNVALYHVENGKTVEMTRVYSTAELDAHNEYYYDIVSGTVTMALASFSEIAVRSNVVNTWNGELNYEWYNAEATELTIANADQLAAFGAIVGGMDGKTQDSFAGKTVKLIADISIGDTESENGLVFYPVGYYNSTGNYNKTSGGEVVSGFKTFKGTFDGQGHTVSDFYQNTWEMFGDYNDGYTGTPNHYRDGMGLFGKVYGGTVKNLTVKNFSSDGEFTTTGSIAAYADCGAQFENIAIVGCNPRVYNIGNGGIVGCIGWYAQTATNDPVTFKNITVDNSNKISALWGSWDVACGGLVGQYYPTSGQSEDVKNAGVHFDNCHVAAQIDVNNDVCANYQYYAYRYAGMLIGSVRENVNGEDGRVYPKMDGITAANCTVHYGTWNDYYYCELVANSLASYTHDHQMSRLVQVDSVDAENLTVTVDGKTTAIPASGRYNYVVVTGEHATENAKCYHFVDGEVWNHEDAGEETVDGETVLKEDKQHLYLEFYDQLVTGYGWGVTSKGIADIPGVTVLDREVAESVEKFVVADNAGTSFVSGTVVNVGDLFAEKAGLEVAIDTDNVQVFVSPADENSTVSGTYVANPTDWTQGKLTLSGAGNAVITITDYNYCVATTLDVTVKPFYIATIRTSGNYWYMTSDLGEAGTKRYQAEDSGSTELPASIAVGNADKAFAFEKNGDNTYSIYAVSVEDDAKYLGWTSGNSGTLVTVEEAIHATVDFEEGNYNIHFAASDAERYLALNGTTGTNYFAWYKSGQKQDLKLIPVDKICQHETTNTVRVEVSCTSVGSETVTCTDCGTVVSYTETPALGHSYTDGICTNCGEAKPESTSARYYIATKRSSGNYFYMTTTVSNSRYQAVDSGVTVLPATITKPVENQVFVLIDNGNGSYSIQAENVTGNNYLGWTSDNTGTFVAEESALELTVDKKDDGTYNIHFATSDAERYLSLNSASGNNYFAWYKGTQSQDLVLIPVEESETTDPTEPTQPSEPVEEETTEGESSEPDASEEETTAPAPAEPETPAATEWTLVTDASALKAGDKIIIAAKDYNYALSTTQNGNNRGQASVTKNGDKLTTPLDEDVQIITLEEGTNTGTFAFNVGTGYLFAASSSSNYLRTETTLSENSSWTIEIVGGVATVTAQGANTHNLMKYNSSSKLFSCYASGQADICIYVLNSSGETGGDSGETTSYKYVKVTENPTDWSGKYLIVYEDGNVAFNGGLTTLDAVSNTISVTISDSSIESNTESDAAAFTIDANGYIKSASGYYIGQTSNANGLKSSTSTTYTNTLSVNADGSVNVVSGGAYLRYNNASDQNRFRYYKSSSYSSQKAICLYKLVEVTE